MSTSSRKSVLEENEVYSDACSSTPVPSASRKRPGSPTSSIPTKNAKDDLSKSHISNGSNMEISDTTDDGVNVTILDTATQKMIESVKHTITTEIGKFFNSQSHTNKQVHDRLCQTET